MCILFGLQYIYIKRVNCIKKFFHISVYEGTFFTISLPHEEAPQYFQIGIWALQNYSFHTQTSDCIQNTTTNIIVTRLTVKMCYLSKGTILNCGLMYEEGLWEKYGFYHWHNWHNSTVLNFIKHEHFKTNCAKCKRDAIGLILMLL